MTAELIEPKQTSPQDKDTVSQFLTIKCSGEKLALNILDVKELIEMTHLTQIPMAPAYIRGVMNLRGEVVPVIDLSAQLTDTPSELSKKSSIVLVDITQGQQCQTLGLLVDEVDEILEFEPSQIQPTPNLGQQIRTDFIHAMGNINEEFIILLDINKLLSNKELEAIEQLTSEQC